MYSLPLVCEVTPFYILFVCSVEQVNNLREVQALRRLSSHPHILELKQVLL